MERLVLLHRLTQALWEHSIKTDEAFVAESGKRREVTFMCLLWLCQLFTPFTRGIKKRRLAAGLTTERVKWANIMWNIYSVSHNKMSSFSLPSLQIWSILLKISTKLSEKFIIADTYNMAYKYSLARISLGCPEKLSQGKKMCQSTIQHIIYTRYKTCN